MATKKDLSQATAKATANIKGLDKATEKVADKIVEHKPQVSQVVKFPKPNGDYYKLDLVVRETVMGANKHMVTTETIKRDYKAYLQSVCGSEGIAKYIQNLIEQDAKKNKYNFD